MSRKFLSFFFLLKSYLVCQNEYEGYLFSFQLVNRIYYFWTFKCKNFNVCHSLNAKVCSISIHPLLYLNERQIKVFYSSSSHNLIPLLSCYVHIHIFPSFTMLLNFLYTHTHCTHITQHDQIIVNKIKVFPLYCFPYFLLIHFCFLNRPIMHH